MPKGIYKRHSNQGFQKGHQINKGKHWKIKDTSKMKGHRNSPKTEFKKGHHPKTEFKKGNISLRTYKPLTKKQKEKISKAVSGKKNPNYIDGRSKENNPYPPAWTKELRQAIRQRDKFVCAICGYYPATTIHHIDYNKQNCEPNNVITLCKKCHAKTNVNRKYWIKYFKRIICF